MDPRFNKEELEEVLENHYNIKNVKIIDMKYSNALPKGENYASLTWRVVLKWRTSDDDKLREERIFIKSLPQGQWIREKIVEFDIFQTEITYYQELVPLYNSLYKNRTGKDLEKFGPVVYKSKRKDLLIMEDVAPAGFRLGDKRNGVDFYHGELVMKSLAQIHALSIAAVRKDPSLKDHHLLQAPIYSKDNLEMMYTMWVANTKELLKEMTTWPNFEQYSGKIRIVGTTEWLLLAKNSGKLRVITQGDSWVNNMLFRYDNTEKKPVEVYLLDFQITHWGPLAFDIVYFIYTSLSPETIFNHLDEIHNIYIEELHKWLKLLNEDIGEYTRENILQDIQEEQRLGLGVVCSYLPTMMAESDDAPSFDNMEDTQNTELKKIRSNPKFRKRLLELLKHFSSNNILS